MESVVKLSYVQGNRPAARFGDFCQLRFNRKALRRSPVTNSAIGFPEQKLAEGVAGFFMSTEWEMLWPAQRRTIRIRAAKEKGRHTKQEWLALKRFFKFRCVRCGWREKPVEKCHGPKFVMERDHVVPISLGGCDCIGNIQPLCNSCNAWKGSKRVYDYRWSRIKAWRLSDV